MPGNPLYCGCDSFVPPGPQYPYSAPSGWFANRGCACGRPSCTCGGNNGCPVQLDFACSIYHKDGNQINNLTPIGLNNGATLNLFAETVAVPVGQVMNVPNYSLPVLRAVPYTINTLQQFATAVDTQFGVVATEISNVTAGNVPITPQNTLSIHLAVSGTNNHTLAATLQVSAGADNLASVISDGLYVTPQTLNYNTATKLLSLSDGNSVDLSSLTCSASGFLGNVTADPGSPVDGNYWFRTDLSAASGLRIRVNGTTRTITTS